MGNLTSPFYFLSLELENVRCFGAKTKLDVSDGKGGPAQWTILLGDNGVGKTTLLQCLAWMRPVPTQDPSTDSARIFLGPALPNEENLVLESLLRDGNRLELEIRAEMSQGKNFGPKKISSTNNEIENIKTAIKVIYDHKRRMLDNHEPQGNTDINPKEEDPEPFIIAYGATRMMGQQNLRRSDLADPIAKRLSEPTELYDAEQVLKELDYAASKKKYKGRENDRLKKVKRIVAKILPDIKNAGCIKILGPQILDTSKEPSGVRFKTFSGLVPLSALSLGYQTTLAWTLDLAWRLFLRYPESPNPLAEPAIVLVDEIDLHLHPLWQRTIIDDLSQLFRRVQFVATSHSPLLVQTALDMNLAVLQKKGGGVEIENNPEVVRSWRVDQILTSHLFDVPTARDKHTEGIFKERDDLLDKPSRTPSEEARLLQLEKQIEEMPTAEDPKDQKAMRLIREAAALLDSRGD